MGIKNYQPRFGYTPDGVITSALIKEMNVPAQSRVQQILINMERMRWMPSRPSGNLILGKYSGVCASSIRWQKQSMGYKCSGRKRRAQHHDVYR